MHAFFANTFQAAAPGPSRLNQKTPYFIFNLKYLFFPCLNPRTAGGLSYLRTAGGGGRMTAPPGLDLSFAGSQGEYSCMWRCPRPGLNPSGLVNNSSLAAGPQFTEVKIL